MKNLLEIMNELKEKSGADEVTIAVGKPYTQGGLWLRFWGNGEEPYQVVMDESVIMDMNLPDEAVIDNLCSQVALKLGTLNHG